MDVDAGAEAEEAGRGGRRARSSQASRFEGIPGGYSSSGAKRLLQQEAAVTREYGIATHRRGGYEVDHLISLELGGLNAIANLWPEAAKPTPGFYEKDQVEDLLHDRVCSGAMTLAATQRAIATDWLAQYRAGGPALRKWLTQRSRRGRLRVDPRGAPTSAAKRGPPLCSGAGLLSPRYAGLLSSTLTAA